jgi:hypothetical protein
MMMTSISIESWSPAASCVMGDIIVLPFKASSLSLHDDISHLYAVSHRHSFLACLDLLSGFCGLQGVSSVHRLSMCLWPYFLHRTQYRNFFLNFLMQIQSAEMKEEDSSLHFPAK